MNYEEWRNQPVRKRQLDKIETLRKLKPHIPEFTGTTQGEASDYINKYSGT